MNKVLRCVMFCHVMLTCLPEIPPPLFQSCIWNSSRAGLLDDGSFSSFSRQIVQRLLFQRLSLLQAIYGVISSALYPQAVTQAPQHLSSSTLRKVGGLHFGNNCHFHCPVLNSNKNRRWENASSDPVCKVKTFFTYALSCAKLWEESTID